MCVCVFYFILYIFFLVSIPRITTICICKPKLKALCPSKNFLVNAACGRHSEFIQNAVLL